MLVELIPSPPLYCLCQFLELDISKESQVALVSITGEKWRAFIYVNRVFSEKKRLILVKSSKKAFEFKERDRLPYIRTISLKNTEAKLLKGKSSLENMFEEFFKRIHGKSQKDDELKHKQISSLLKAINQSKSGKKTLIKHYKSF